MMHYCASCVMPNTKPGIWFDENGVCNACRTAKIKRTLDWDKKEKELSELATEIKNTNTAAYDCLVPVSGGKDGFYQVYKMQQYGLKVLAVVLAPHVPTTEGIFNLNNLVNQLNVDLVKITLKPSTVRKLRRRTFIERGEPNWVEHCAMFSAVTRVAVSYHVPLVVWGEDIAVEFGGQQRDSACSDATNINKNDLIKDKTIRDFMSDDIDEKDIFFYQYPDYKVLQQHNIKIIYLGYYHFWDGYLHYLKAKEYGFKARGFGPLSGNYLDYDNIDEKLCEINIWLKYIKFGFWRATDQTCYHIWNNYLDRSDAVEIVKKLQDQFPQEYFQDFLRFHCLTESEFWSVVEKFRNQKIWVKCDNHWKLRVPLE